MDWRIEGEDVIFNQKARLALHLPELFDTPPALRHHFNIVRKRAVMRAKAQRSDQPVPSCDIDYQPSKLIRPWEIRLEDFATHGAPSRAACRRSPGDSAEDAGKISFSTFQVDQISSTQLHERQYGRYGAFPPPSRQLMTPQATQSTSTDDHNEDHDSFFSETAEKLLSPRSKSIDDLRTSYRQTSDTYIAVTRILYPQLLSPHDSEDRIDVQREILILELYLARTKLALDYRTSHYEMTRKNQSWSSVLPKLAVTKGWLEECVQRIEDPTSRPDCKSGNFFFELSHYFLATIVKQHQDSLFEGRQLPSEDEIFEVFQRAEPRPRGSGLGPYLEELTGVETLDPELMPEVLLRLERKLASHSSTSKTSWPVPKDMVSVDFDRQLALRHEISQLKSLVERNQIRTHDPLDVDAIEHERDSGSDVPTHVAPHDDSEDLENHVGSPQHWNASVSMTDDVNMDGNINQDEWVASDFGLDLRGLDPEILTAEQVAERDVLLERDAEAAASSSQSSHDQANAIKPLDVLRDEGMEPMNHEPEEQHYQTEPQPDFTSLSRRQQYERIAGRELSCDTSQMGSSPWSSSQPDLQANRPDLAADQSLTVFSDLPDFDELMQDLPDEENLSQQQMVSQQQMHPEPLQHSVPDTDFVSDDDELPPDSNPWLAAIRARTSATSSVSNTPTSSAPTNSQAPRRTGPRKSEPIVLIDTTPRSKQRPRISDSMFVSDDEFDSVPPSSNPHLAAALRRMAGSASNTPTSSASTSRTSTPKLPPHLAPVRRAAHRKSLDPSSQIPSAEEREILSQTEYPVDDIINEKTVNGEKKYLIKWKPIHGREFMDTWEPAENANALAVRDWELTKMKKAQWRKKPTKKAVEATPEQPREPSPILGEEDTPMFFVDTAGDKSVGARFVPTPRAYPSSPASLSTDQVSAFVQADTSQPSAHITVAPESITNDAPEPALEPAQKGVGNYWGTGKHPTQAQQRARMREKREEKRAAKAEGLANMTEKERADAAHNKAMQNKAKKERKRTKAERYAARRRKRRTDMPSCIMMDLFNFVPSMVTRLTNIQVVHKSKRIA
ncbi:hypothetical protein KCU79_g158, partial [Aureobasidium melanogenum]